MEILDRLLIVTCLLSLYFLGKTLWVPEWQPYQERVSPADFDIRFLEYNAQRFVSQFGQIQMFRSRHLNICQSRSVTTAAQAHLVVPWLTPRLQSCRSVHAVAHEPASTTAWTPSHSEFFNAAHISKMKRRKIDFERKSKRSLKAAKFDGPINKDYPEGSHAEILAIEVQALLEKTDGQFPDAATQSASKDSTPPERFQEYVVEIVERSSTGDGLAYGPSKDHILVVPASIPGDIVVAKPYEIHKYYSHTILIKVNEESPDRTATPQCKYFGKCSGCQFQMLSYEKQLQNKKEIVERAFKNFSNLVPELIPEVKETMGSPLQYRYRTKLNPHFQVSPRTMGKVPPIGFMQKGYKTPIDIESCPIGTDIVQQGMTQQRAKVVANIDQYKRGATILLRESTFRVPNSDFDPDFEPNADPRLEENISKLPSDLDYDSAVISRALRTRTDGRPEYVTKYDTHTDYSTYTSDERSTTVEFIGPYRFMNKAGSFFQNNNSILRPFTQYVYDNCIPQKQKQENDTTSTTTQQDKQIRYLLDAYCGSGLFTITLSPLFSSALGIDIDQRGIEAAEVNAQINGIKNAGFIAADASDLFADVPYPREQTLVVIDPPRKGASLDFLRQLAVYGPKRVIYVSCNVHTQARDVGFMVRGFADQPGSWKYEIESLKGFDFFPQTGHVEGVCVLNRVEKEAGDEVGEEKVEEEQK